MKRKAEDTASDKESKRACRFGPGHSRTTSEPTTGSASSRVGSSENVERRKDGNELMTTREIYTCFLQPQSLSADPSCSRAIASVNPTKAELSIDNNKSSSSSDVAWVWDDEVSMKSNVQLCKNKTEVRFHTNYSLGTASARSNQPLVAGQNYWEIKMVSPVYGTDMMIGVGTKKIDPEKYINQFCSMLGTDAKEESCGLSYLGYFYFGGNRKSFCSRFGQGAVIGVHLDLWTGSLSFYKDGTFLGVACKGLKGREWYPMVSSTAAKSTMCLIRTASFESSLQYMCCQTLRKAIPSELDVLSVLNMPPGLKKFLKNNLFWLLGAQIGKEDIKTRSQGTQTGAKNKRSRKTLRHIVPSTSSKK